MTVEFIQTLSLIAYILAGVFLLVGIAQFFLLNIPKLIGDVSGSTARKAIESIRQQNESTGDKAYKPSQFNVERGRLTDKISQSGRLVKNFGNLGVAVGTEKFSTTELAPSTNETTILDSGASETTILSVSTGETAMLNTLGASTYQSTQDIESNQEFCVLINIGFTGSAEVIE